MSHVVPVHVLGASVWTPGVAGARPVAELLPARMRGRASLLTAMLATVVEQAARAAQLDPRGMPMIFGSAYGEMATTAALLAQLYAADGRLSPAKFQASVHNTAAGQLSIALGNPQFSTSIAAGSDTLAMCLIEAHAWLARHQGRVLVACGDEPPCTELAPDRDDLPLAAALVLSSEPHAGSLAALGLPSLQPSAASAERGLRSQLPPLVAADGLVQALQAGCARRVVLSERYVVDVHQVAP
ncbi:MAG: beta-ketoacyl synthase chain length factor [Polyangiales bacterium]